MSAFTRFFIGLMALYLLNFSVDAPNPSVYKVCNLNYNEQESLLELLLEKALGYENAIEEFDDTDSDDEHLLKKERVLDQYILWDDSNPIDILPERSAVIPLSRTIILSQLLGDSESPPPWSVFLSQRN